MKTFGRLLILAGLLVGCAALAEPPSSSPAASLPTVTTLASIHAQTSALVPRTSAPAQTPPETVRASPAPMMQKTIAPLRAEVIEYGDHVVATGNVMAPEGREPYLCFDPLFIGRFSGCGMTLPEVHLLNLDVRSLPGRERHGTYVTSLMEVRGTWREDGIDVSDTHAIEVEQTPEAPCSPPAGGWPGVGDEEDRYRNERRLGDYVGQRYDVFSGWWVARTSPEPYDRAHRVLVVGATVDPATVIDDLRAVFPSNLCVEQVEFSHNKLYAVIRVLLEPNPPWNRTIDDRRNRVIIQPLMLDEAVIAAMTRYLDRVLIEPAVRLER